MTTPDTRTVVDTLLRHIGAGDLDGIAAVYAETVDWRLNWPEAELGRAATPWIKPRSTGAEAVDNYRELAGYNVPGESDIEVERILVDGTEAVVMGEVAHTAKPTGRRYRLRYALHLTVEDGRITRHHIYEDSLAVAQAFQAE